MCYLFVSIPYLCHLSYLVVEEMGLYYCDLLLSVNNPLSGGGGGGHKFDEFV